MYVHHGPGTTLPEAHKWSPAHGLGTTGIVSTADDWYLFW